MRSQKGDSIVPLTELTFWELESPEMMMAQCGVIKPNTSYTVTPQNRLITYKIKEGFGP